MTEEPTQSAPTAESPEKTTLRKAPARPKRASAPRTTSRAPQPRREPAASTAVTAPALEIPAQDAPAPSPVSLPEPVVSSAPAPEVIVPVSAPVPIPVPAAATAPVPAPRIPAAPPTPPPPPAPAIYAEGIVEVSGKGFGFLREAKRNFAQSNNDIFVTPEVVRKYGLRDGMWIRGETRRGSRGPQLFRLTELEGEDPDNFQNLPIFEELTTINPNKRIRMETVPDRYTTRIIDLMTPVGKGQRGLIVAPPRTGKTTLLQHIADAVVKNHTDMKLIILLVDERPEEVTEIRRTVPSAELMASSNDCDIKTHTRIAQLAIERAKRLV
ncbi:MAG: hypothetical protein ACOYM3_11155, partial [Terrimicrobiaceae bacterium]